MHVIKTCIIIPTFPESSGHQAFPPLIFLNPRQGDHSIAEVRRLRWKAPQDPAAGKPRSDSDLQPQLSHSRDHLYALLDHTGPRRGAQKGSRVSPDLRSPRELRIPSRANAGPRDPTVGETGHKGPGPPSWVTSPSPTELGRGTPGCGRRRRKEPRCPLPGPRLHVVALPGCAKSSRNSGTVRKHSVPQPRPLFAPGSTPNPEILGQPISPQSHGRGAQRGSPIYGRGRSAPGSQRPHPGPRDTLTLRLPPPGLLRTAGNFSSADAPDAPRPRPLTSAQQRGQHQAERPAQRRHPPGGRALGAHLASRQLRPPAARRGRRARSWPPPAVPCPGATPGSESASRAAEPVFTPRPCRVHAAAPADPAEARALAGTTFLQPPPQPRPVPPPGPPTRPRPLGARLPAPPPAAPPRAAGCWRMPGRKCAGPGAGARERGWGAQGSGLHPRGPSSSLQPSAFVPCGSRPGEFCAGTASQDGAGRFPSPASRGPSVAAPELQVVP